MRFRREKVVTHKLDKPEVTLALTALRLKSRYGKTIASNMHHTSVEILASLGEDAAA